MSNFLTAKNLAEITVFAASFPTAGRHLPQSSFSLKYYGNSQRGAHEFRSDFKNSKLSAFTITVGGRIYDFGCNLGVKKISRIYELPDGQEQTFQN